MIHFRHNLQNNRLNVMIFRLLRFLLDEFSYVHRIQTLLIDKNTKKVYTDIEKSIFESKGNQNILHDLWNKMFGTFELDSEIIEKIKHIVDNLINNPQYVQNLIAFLPKM